VVFILFQADHTTPAHGNQRLRKRNPNVADPSQQMRRVLIACAVAFVAGVCAAAAGAASMAWALHKQGQKP